MINQEHFREGNDELLDISIPKPWDFSEDDEEIFHRLVRWQELHSPGNENFSIRRYEDLFVSDSKLLCFYDQRLEYDSHIVGKNRYSGTKLKPKNRLYPNSAMVIVELDRIVSQQDFAASYLCAWSYHSNNFESLESSYHVTHVWKKEDGIWRIMHEHVSPNVRESGLPAERINTED